VTARSPARRTTAGAYDSARFSIEVQDGGTLSPLPSGYASLLQDVELDQVWDGADELRLEFAGMDDDRNLRVIGERVLEPGTSLVLRAGYGRSLHAMGQFTVGSHEAAFTEDGPAVTVIATDGFRRMMDDTWPSVLSGLKRSGTTGKAQRASTWTDAAKVLARKFGFGFVADVGPRIPEKTRYRRTRKGKKKGRRRRKVRDVIIKNAGETDASMIKHIAGFAGFMHPKVRYIEGTSELAKQLARDHAIAEALDNRDVLFFRAANIQRQLREVGSLKFRYRRKSGAPATLSEFAPTWDTDEVPVAVRISGIVGEGKRREVVTVEAELVGPEQYRRRSALLRQAARAKDPAKRRELEAEARGLKGEVSITRVRRSRATKKDRKAYVNAETALIEVLENERKAGRELDWSANDPRRRRKVQTMRRETIRRTFVVRTTDDLEKMARAWLLTRLQLHQSATADSSNIPGLELVYPQQVHELEDVSPEYDGLWMIMKSTHRWTDDGHECSMLWERVADLPSRVRGQTRRTQT